MILLDTHAWVWWGSEPEKLSSRARGRVDQAEKGEVICVSAISCWEIAMLVAKGRLKLSMDVETWIEKSLGLPQIKLIDLTPKIAVLSSRLSGIPPKDPSDRILIATAQAHNCPIVTKDRQILGYPHVQSIW